MNSKLSTMSRCLLQPINELTNKYKFLNEMFHQFTAIISWSKSSGTVEQKTMTVDSTGSHGLRPVSGDVQVKVRIRSIPESVDGHVGPGLKKILIFIIKKI